MIKRIENIVPSLSTHRETRFLALFHPFFYIGTLTQKTPLCSAANTNATVCDAAGAKTNLLSTGIIFGYISI